MSDIVELKPGAHKFSRVLDLALAHPNGIVHTKTLQSLGFNPADTLHLQDNKGFLHADKIQEYIDSMPSVKIEKPNLVFNGNSLVHDRHRRIFDAKHYGLDRRNFIDHDRAFDRHMADFDPSVIHRDHYDDTLEDTARYHQAVADAREEHASNFDPQEWSDDDTLLRPEYFSALSQAQREHDGKMK